MKTMRNQPSHRFSRILVVVGLFSFSALPAVAQVKMSPHDGGRYDRFGAATALSQTGRHALIGAPEHGDKSATPKPGAAYLFVRQGNEWHLDTKLVSDIDTLFDFGRTLAMSGDADRLLISGDLYPSEYGMYPSVNGTVHVLYRSNGSWTREARFVSPEGADGYGKAIAVSDDGSFALVGSAGADVGDVRYAGQVYAYEREDSTWSRPHLLTASDGAGSDHFGKALDISPDGGYAIIGADGVDRHDTLYQAGAAYIFLRSDSEWTEQAKLLPPDPNRFGHFGWAVAIADDGTRAIVGAPRDSENGENAGAAYIYVRTDSGWDFEKKVTLFEGRGGDTFGRSVAISDDGRTALVGGTQIANEGNGVVQLFRFNGVEWQASTLIKGNESKESFGWTTSLSGNNSYALIGAYLSDGPRENTGGAYAYSISALLPIEVVPDKYTDVTLHQNYPNPVGNNDPFLAFDLMRPGLVRLSLYDALGRKVRVLLHGYRPAGKTQIRVNTKQLAPGLYFYRLDANHETRMRMMTIVN